MRSYKNVRGLFICFNLLRRDVCKSLLLRWRIMGNRNDATIRKCSEVYEDNQVCSELIRETLKH